MTETHGQDPGAPAASALLTRDGLDPQDAPVGEASALMIYVVAKHRLDLFEMLRREFADEPALEVRLDKRLGERRLATGSPGERRLAERRRRHVDEHLRTLGWALVEADPR